MLVASLFVPDRRLIGISYLTPIAYFVSILADLGAAVVLIATLRTSALQRSTVVLALSFTVSAALLLVAMAILPMLPNEPATAPSPPGTAIWIFVLWHFSVACGAVTYVITRYRDDGHSPTRNFLTLAIASALTFFVGICLFAFALGPFLPRLASGATVVGLMTTGLGPASVAILIVASVLVSRLPKPSAVDRALAWSLYALAASMLMFFIGGHRYTVDFYLSRALILIANLFIVSAAIRTLIASRLQHGETERALAVAVDEAERQATRIRAVWEIASKVDVPDDSYGAILKIATHALRPDTSIFGMLSHLEDDRLVTDARAWTRLGGGIEKVIEVIYPGVSVAFESTVQSLLQDTHGARAWNNLNDLGENNVQFEQLGMQSVVGTGLIIGRRHYFLTFSAFDVHVRPFAEDDVAFVDVVAAFFSSRFSQQQQSERIKFQIEHDALTGLINRVQFRKFVREECLANEPFTVAFVDIDGFRHINDREGSMIADEVLVEVATELAAVSSSNVVSRMSADEFGLLVRHDREPDSAADALKAYQSVFRTQFHTGDRFGTRMLGLSASIGGASYPANGHTPEDLMRRADAALNVVKERGGAGVVLFDTSMEKILAETRLRTVELAEAVAQDQLALVYQPTYNLVSRTLVGAEALCRWDHPRRGRLLPAEFIPFAEKHLLMKDLSRWVFRKAVEDILSVRLPAGLRIYFNLAAESLEDGEFIAEMREAINLNPNLAEHLGVEVTETTAMRNIERCINTVDILRSWGLSVAIDDFGTGYSSLAYLRQLTVDVIKLDRSFITGLPNDEGATAITSMLLNVTKHFGFSTLAEGVETEEQAAWLTLNGCRFAQGYLFAKPMAFDAFSALANPS